MFGAAQDSLRPRHGGDATVLRLVLGFVVLHELSPAGSPAYFGRAGLAIPRSTLAQWVGSCGVQLQPLVDAMKDELLQHRVLHADETPVSMLKPGNGKTHRAYRSGFKTPSLRLSSTTYRADPPK